MSGQAQIKQRQTIKVIKNKGEEFMRKTIYALVLFVGVLFAMGENPDAPPAYNLLGELKLEGKYAAEAQQFSTEKTGLKLDSLIVVQQRGSNDPWNDRNLMYNARLYISRTDKNLELRNIQYEVRFYDDYGDELAFTDNHGNTTNVMVIEDNNPGFPNDQTIMTGAHYYRLENKPAFAKIDIKRYMKKDGTAVKF
jgi:hypothetical protein